MSSNSDSEHTVADRYVLRRELGRGGMGVVWEAFDPSLDRVVAIKQVLLPDHFTDEERADAHARVRREAQSAARISHPSVITIHDVFQFEGDPWVVMELVEGGSLQEMLNEHGPLDLETAAAVAESLLRAVRAADAAGVLHRDIKPGNIMMSSDGRVILTDFGIATMEGGPSITRTGALIGSPEYMPPERLEGGPAEHRGDLWSIGVTLFAAVEGTSPFRRDSITAAIAAVMSAELPPMSSAGWLGPVIEGLLERDPDRRLTTGAALDLLRERRDGAGAGDDASAVGTGPNTPGPVAGGAIGAAAGTAGAAGVAGPEAPGTGAVGPGAAGTAGYGSGPHSSPSGGHTAPSGGYAAPSGGYLPPPGTRPAGPPPGPGGGHQGPPTPAPGPGRPPAYGYGHGGGPMSGAGHPAAGHPSGGRPGGGGPPTGHLHSGGAPGGGSGSGSTSRILLGAGAGAVALLLIAVVTVMVVVMRTGGSGQPVEPAPEAGGPAGGEAEPGELESDVTDGPSAGADDDDDDDGEGPPPYDSLETFDSGWFSVDYPQGWHVDDSDIDNTFVAILAGGGNHQVWVSGWTEEEFTGTSEEFLAETDGGTNIGGATMPGYTQLDLEVVDDHDLGEGWDVARVEAEFTNDSWTTQERRFWSYAMSTDYQGDRVFYLMSVNVPVSDADFYADLPEDVFETFSPNL